jgi:hypothetical protein
MRDGVQPHETEAKPTTEAVHTMTSRAGRDLTADDPRANAMLIAAKITVSSAGSGGSSTLIHSVEEQYE